MHTSGKIPTNLEIKIEEIVTLLVLNGCETWSLSLTDDHRLRVLENGVLRRMFGPKTEAVIGGWRDLYNEELLNLCSLLDIVILSHWSNQVCALSILVLYLTQLFHTQLIHHPGDGCSKIL
jgi:hypothetical protein